MNARTLSALALAALAAVPSTGSAQAKKGTRTQATHPAATPATTNALSFGGFLGYEWGDADGFQVRVDGEMPFQQLTPQVKLSLVGSIGLTHASYSVFGLDVTENRVKIVPTARFTLPLNPQVSVFGDAGLGLHYTSVNLDYVFFPHTTDSEVNFLLRFGAGGFFQVNPRTRIGGELVLDPIFGTYHDTTFALMLGLMYQI